MNPTQDTQNLKCRHCQKVIGREHTLNGTLKTIVPLKKNLITKTKFIPTLVYGRSFYEDSFQNVELRIQIRCSYCSKKTTFISSHQQTIS